MSRLCCQDDCLFFDPVTVGVEHRLEALGATLDPGATEAGDSSRVEKATACDRFGRWPRPFSSFLVQHSETFNIM